MIFPPFTYNSNAITYLLHASYCFILVNVKTSKIIYYVPTWFCFHNTIYPWAHEFCFCKLFYHVDTQKYEPQVGEIIL